MKQDQIEKNDKKLYEGIASKYLKKDLSRYNQIARKLRLTQTLRSVNKPIKNLLELGCGAGFSAKYLKGDYENYVGIDYSENLIKYAKKYNSAKNVEFFAMNIKDFKAKEKYDVILMIGVLHHMTDRVNALKQLKKFLKADGMLAFNEPQGTNPFIQLLRKFRQKIDSTYSADQDYFRHSEIRKIFDEAGFDIKIAPQGFYTTPFAEYVKFPQIIAIPLVKMLKPIDKILERLCANTPMKYLSWNMVIQAHPKTK